MPVTSQLTSLIDFEGAPSFAGYGGGQGASANTDVFIQGSQSGGRRVDNSTNKGFGGTFTNTDLSAAGEHVKIWLFVTQWASVTQVQARISSGSDDDHELPTSEYPALGGFIPLWVDVSRAPEVGGSANEASIGEIGILLDIGDVGGNAQNLIVDEINHGTSGYLWTGASGDIDEFRTFESTNNDGVLITQNGIDFCYARLEIGSATSAGFTDSGFTLAFPNQSLVSSTFMGLTVDLQNGSTLVDLSNATIQSSSPANATNRPDLLVSGTSGSFDMSTLNLLGLRTIELTSGCTLTDSLVSQSGVVNLGNDAVDLTGTSVSLSIVAANESAISWNSSTDPDGFLDNMSFSKGSNAHHAIEFGTSSPTSITLRDIDFSGFGAGNNANDSTFNILRTSGTVDINIVGGSGNVSYRTAGATVNIIQNPVTTTVGVLDPDGADLENASVLLYASNGTGDLPFQDSVSITRSGTTATVTHTGHGLSTNNYVIIKGANQSEYNGLKQITVTTANAYTFTVTGSPTTPATGTIVSTGVLIYGTTSALGTITDTRTLSSNQPVVGWVRKATTAPRLKQSTITGTVSSTTGATFTVQMISDE